jgi:hypothetical protein
MRHARSDYDAIQPWPTKRPHIVKVDGVTIQLDSYDYGVGAQPIIPDDEPVFLVRAQDAAAIHTMQAWCEAAQIVSADEDIIATVKRHIELVRDWQAEHGVKVPDAPADTLR